MPAWVIGPSAPLLATGRPQAVRAATKPSAAPRRTCSNLVPSIGEINGDRSNLSFAWLPQPPTQYGACPMVVDFQAGKAMPRPRYAG